MSSSESCPIGWISDLSSGSSVLNNSPSNNPAAGSSILEIVINEINMENKKQGFI